MPNEPAHDEPISISVIIPVYNAARFLAAAVANVRSQNQQQLEIIVVDDGSTDDAADVAAGLGVRYYHQANSGPAAARNAGIEQARGEFIAFLDADDLWAEGSLKARLDCLRQNPHIEIALGKARCLRDVEPTSGNPDAPTFELSDPFVSFCIGAALYRKSVFETIGVFDTTLRFGEDTDWFLRAREAGVGLLVLPQTALHYRLHEGGMTSGKTAAELNMVQVLKKSLDRRRRSTPNAATLPNLTQAKSE